jgi:hypothetical protein
VSLPESTLGRIAAAVVAAVVLLLVLSQLFLPGIGEGAIEDRLTEGGGIAHVSLGATPAARLLWGDGDRLEIDATGLDLDVDLDRDPQVFRDLDPFGDVEIVLNDSRAGPVDVDSFLLTRKGEGPYALRTTGSTSIADVAEFFAEDAAVPGSGILGDVIGATGLGAADVDVDLDMLLDSDEGQVVVVDGGGEIAGIPTGPLAGLITQAIVVRI